MAATKHTMKMPELLVFAKMFVVGLVAAEVCRTTYYLGTAFVPAIADFPLWAKAIPVLIGLAVCVVYAINRGAHRLQVRAEATLGTTVRMGNGETGLRSLAAHCATSCHNGLPIITIDLQVCAFDTTQRSAWQNTQLLNYTTSPGQSQTCGRKSACIPHIPPFLPCLDSTRMRPVRAEHACSCAVHVEWSVTTRHARTMK